MKGARERLKLPETDLSPAFAPVFAQSMRSTCVAAAVTGLVEYFEDFKTQLSVQYLHEAIARLSNEWVKRNMEKIRAGAKGEEEFEALYRKQLLQIRLVGRTNGFDSPNALALVDAFEANLAERIERRAGSPIAGAFGALLRYGICRNSLWPYAGADSAGRNNATLGKIPFGADDDAARHRFGERELYLLRTPNNVDEIRGIIAGANSYRPMPVAVSVALFAGCAEKGRFAFPETEETPDGHLAAKNAFEGCHAVLATGFRDDPKLPGGGEFIFRNSWGDAWGEGGYGRMSYAYLECFCEEAGTILQQRFADEAAGYGAKRRVAAVQTRSYWWLNFVAAAFIIAATIAAMIFFDRQDETEPRTIPETLKIPETPPPEKTEIPEAPEIPEKPEALEIPEKPEKPEAPEIPEKPEKPEIPDKPEIPASPEKPEKPEAPEIPEKPEIPDKPEIPAPPEKPEKPEIHAQPGAKSGSRRGKAVNYFH